MGWMLTHPKSTEANELAQSSLVAHLAPVPDPRIDRRKDHALVDTGQTHLNTQQTEQIGMIPGCIELLAADATFLGLLSLE